MELELVGLLTLQGERKWTLPLNEARWRRASADEPLPRGSAVFLRSARACQSPSAPCVCARAFLNSQLNFKNDIFLTDKMFDVNYLIIIPN